MEPYKHEEQFKNKLEQRKLQPSPEAWDKLAQRLDKTSKAHKSKKLWYIGLAASIVGLLFLGLPFWTDNQNTENPKEVVSKPQVEMKKPVSNESAGHQVAKEHVETNTLKTENETLKSNSPKAKAIPRKENINPIQITANKVPLKKENKAMPTKEKPITALTFEEQKIQEVVAKVEALKQEYNAVTDDDIDALLLQAQKEIQLNKLINKHTGMVDAEALLQDVEAELDLSFRNKVFEAIKSSYNSVKTAVAQRND